MIIYTEEMASEIRVTSQLYVYATRFTHETLDIHGGCLIQYLTPSG